MQSDRGGTVAVVDDDESMRTYLGETLSSAGYKLRSFSNSGKVRNCPSSSCQARVIFPWLMVLSARERARLSKLSAE